jgi:hypothetical protein
VQALTLFPVARQHSSENPGEQAEVVVDMLVVVDDVVAAAVGIPDLQLQSRQGRQFIIRSDHLALAQMIMVSAAVIHGSIQPQILSRQQRGALVAAAEERLLV